MSLAGHKVADRGRWRNIVSAPCSVGFCFDLPLEGEWRQALEDFREYVSEQTLTAELHLDPIKEPQGDPGSDNILHTARFGGVDVRFSLSRVSD